MSSYSNHLYLMSAIDEQYQFWFHGLGLHSNNYHLIAIHEEIPKTGIKGLSNKIELNIIKNNISLLLIEASWPFLNPFFLFYLKKKYNLMIVLLNIDDEFKFEWITTTYGTIADLILSFDYISVQRFRQSGANAFHFMHPILIPEDNIFNNQLTKNDISFVGRVEGKPSRYNLLKYLDREGFDVKTFKSKDVNDPSYLSNDDMYSIYNNSTINLSFSGITSYGKPNSILFYQIRGGKARPFEIASAKGFCLCEFSISTSKWFKDGEEIVFFYSHKDLKEKINYYLSNPNEAKKIAIAGSKNVRKNFSSDAISTKFIELINDSKDNIGFDLYGNPHLLKVSPWFAHSISNIYETFI